MYCKKCGFQVGGSSRFCSKCGTKLENAEPESKVCPSCKKTFDFNMFFCDVCGNRLKEQSAIGIISNNKDNISNSGHVSKITYSENNGHGTKTTVNYVGSGKSSSSGSNRTLGSRVLQTGMVNYIKTSFLLEPTGKITLYDNGLVFEVSMLGSSKHNHTIYFDDVSDILKTSYLGTPWSIKVVKKNGETFEYNLGVLNKTSLDTIINTFEIYKVERR